MLICENVTHDFAGRRAGLHRDMVRAVDDISLQLDPGGVLCIVGESGCGKTTLGRVVAGLCPPTAGRVTVDGTPLYTGPRSARQQAGAAIQFIHQDPFASLNPALTVFDQLAMPLLEHRIVGRGDLRPEAIRLLELTGLDASETLDRYPHQLSGGQRQRVTIARALTVRPKYLVGDEAVTMVDVSSRLVLLALLRDICSKQNIGLVFITHDLAVARYIGFTGKMTVLYRGRIVEHGPTDQVIRAPQHPYTRVLLSAVPPLITGDDYHIDRLTPTAYELTDRAAEEVGCVFVARCPLAIPECRTTTPILQTIDSGVDVACHLLHADADLPGRVSDQSPAGSPLVQ